MMNHTDNDPLDTSPKTDAPVAPEADEAVAARLDADVREFVARSRARLRYGGPAVDPAAVADFIGCELPAGEDERVRGLVTTYRAWHDAFWLQYGPLAADLANPGDGSDRKP